MREAVCFSQTNVNILKVDSDSDTVDELPPAVNFLTHQDTPSPQPPQQLPFAELLPAVAIPPETLMPEQEAQQPSTSPIFWDPINDLTLNHEDTDKESSKSMSLPAASPLPNNNDRNASDLEAKVGLIAPRVQPPRHQKSE